MEEERQAVQTIPKTQVYFWGSAECDQFDLKDAEGEDLPECKRPYRIENFVNLSINVISIACGGLHTIFLSDLGKVYSCGCNDVYTLGRNDPDVSERVPGLVNLPVPVNMISAGDSHSVAVNSVASLVYFWGVYKNTNGNMQKPSEKPIRIGEDVFNKPITKLLSGYNHTMILMDKKVYCWGDQDTKVLGRKSNTRQNISQSLKPEALGVRKVLDVFTGGYHSFVKVQKPSSKKSGPQMAYYGWGLNNYGQLGIGSTQDALVPTEIEEFRNKDIIQIVGGEHHTLALEADGSVYSFGRNDDGQIGQGEELNETLKQQAQDDRQNQIDELKQQTQQTVKSQKIQQKREQALHKLEENQRVIGYEYITKPKKLEGLENITQIAAAGHYSYAFNLEIQKFFSWGMGSSYVLGTREEDSVFEPYDIPKQFFKGEKVLQISLGGQHVAVLTSADQTYKLPEIEEGLLTVPENLKLPKLKTFRKTVPESQDKDSKKSKPGSKSSRGLKQKKKEQDDLEEPVSKLKLD